MATIALPDEPMDFPGWLLGLGLMFMSGKYPSSSNSGITEVPAVDPISGDYFIDCDNGNDSNSGTSQGDPWLNIQKAADVVQAGDVVMIMNSTCTGPRAGDDFGEIVKLTSSGASGNLITFRNFPGHTPQIGTWPADFDEKYGFFLDTASYIRIEGLLFRGMVFMCIRLDNLNAVQGFEIINNTFDGCGKAETDGTNTSGHDAVFAGRLTTDTLIEGNIFANSGRTWDSGCDALGQSSCHQYRHDHALYLKGGRHVVRNNVFYENNMGYGIKIDGHTLADDFDETGIGTEFSHVIVNNTFGPNNSLQPWDGRSGNPITVFRNGENPKFPRYLIANNIFVDPSIVGADDPSAVMLHTGLSASDSPWDNFCVDNISTGTDATATCVEYDSPRSDTITSTGNTLSETVANLDFADSGNDNYRIGGSSSAINYGDATIQSVPTVDFDGTARDFAGNDVDNGAFEN
jgi:hypothetical protein